MTSILTAIKNRRTVKATTQKAIEREIIEQILDAGCCAPSHKKTYPWRFSVFTGAGVQQLNKACWHDVTHDTNATKIAHKKAFKTPVVIMVWAAIGRAQTNPPVWEEEAATAACIQNMLLAAEAFSLASFWRTGAPVTMRSVQALCSPKNETFNAAKGDRIMGFVCLGEPDISQPKPAHTPQKASAVTDWIQK